MTEPKVSVTIPAHNRADLIGHAIRSVLTQTGAEVEVIVVDDASTDATSTVLDSFSGLIRTIRTRESIERGAARNLGVQGASNDWIAFLDSDDEWRDMKLAKQFQRIGRKSASVTGVRLIDTEGRPTGAHRVPPRDADARITWENPYFGGPSSLLMRRSTFTDIGGFVTDRVVQGSEDWIFFASLIAAGIEIDVVPEPLVRYRVHQTNSTADPNSVARSMWAAVDLMVQRGLVPARAAGRCRARTAHTIARQFAAARDWSNAGLWVRRSVRSSPGEAVRTLAGVGATAGKATILRGRTR